MPASPGKRLLRRSKISIISRLGKPAVKAYWAWAQRWRADSPKPLRLLRTMRVAPRT